MGKRDDTARRLEAAFLELYADRPLDQITVRELAQRAGVSRGTFYLYHDDLAGLLTAIEDAHLGEIQRLNTAHRRFYLSPDAEELKRFYLPTLEYIDAHRATFRTLFSPHARPRFRDGFKRLMRDNVRRKYGAMAGRPPGWDQYQRYIIDVLVAGNIGIIAHWVTSDADLTPQDVADLFADILAHLPYTALRR